MSLALFIIFFWLMMIALLIISFVFWIWALIDCATNEPSQGNDKVIWILILIFTHWVGSLIYVLVRRPERQRLYGR